MTILDLRYDTALGEFAVQTVALENLTPAPPWYLRSRLIAFFFSPEGRAFVVDTTIVSYSLYTVQTSVRLLAERTCGTSCFKRRRKGGYNKKTHENHPKHTHKTLRKYEI